MFATEPLSYAMTDEYVALFHRYLTRSIEVLYARIGPELQQLSHETREQAWHLLDYGLKLTHSWELVRQLLLALAPRMERDGFRHEWLPYLEGGVALSRRVQDVGGEAQLSLYIGRLYRLRGELATAHTWLLLSAELCQQVGDMGGRAKALNQLGYVARLQSQFVAAKGYVEEALSLLNEEDSERATSYSWLGAIAYDQMDWALAETHYQRAYQIWQEAKDQQRAAWSLQNLGNTLRGADEYDKAAEYIQQAVVLLGQLHDPVNQAIARMNLGIVHLHRSEAEQALALLSLAENVFRQVGDQLHLGMVYNNISIAERELAHWQAAEQACHKAVQLWEALGNLKLMAGTLEELGLTYFEQARVAEAIATFKRALEILYQVPPDPFQKMLSNSLTTHIEKARLLGSI